MDSDLVSLAHATPGTGRPAPGRIEVPQALSVPVMHILSWHVTAAATAVYFCIPYKKEQGSSFVQIDTSSNSMPYLQRYQKRATLFGDNCCFSACSMHFLHPPGGRASPNPQQRYHNEPLHAT